MRQIAVAGILRALPINVWLQMTFMNTMSIFKYAKWRDARWTLALRNWISNAAALIVRFKGLAPYALVELVLPGGTVIALLLWLYRRRKNT